MTFLSASIGFFIFVIYLLEMKEKTEGKKNTEDNQRSILFNSSGEGALNEDNRASNDSKFAVENSSGNFSETFYNVIEKCLLSQQDI